MDTVRTTHSVAARVRLRPADRERLVLAARVAGGTVAALLRRGGLEEAERILAGARRAAERETER